MDVDDLQKNPFYRYETEGDNDQNKNLAQMQKELTRKASLLQLQSVLQGPEGSRCLINGGIYAINQKVAGAFTITAINKNNVILRSGDFEVVLEM
jgi:hypothetical protein